jgi:hypothetical protein
MPQEPDYTSEIYKYLGTLDKTYQKEISLDKFKESMKDKNYASDIHSWIGSKDETFTKDVPFDDFYGSINPKTPAVPSFSTDMSNTLPVMKDSPLQANVDKVVKEPVVPAMPKAFSIPKEKAIVDKDPIGRTNLYKSTVDNITKRISNNLLIADELGKKGDGQGMQNVMSQINQDQKKIESLNKGIDAQRVIAEDMGYNTKGESLLRGVKSTLAYFLTAPEGYDESISAIERSFYGMVGIDTGKMTKDIIDWKAKTEKELGKPIGVEEMRLSDDLAVIGRKILDQTSKEKSIANLGSKYSGDVIKLVKSGDVGEIVSQGVNSFLENAPTSLAFLNPYSAAGVVGGMMNQEITQAKSEGKEIGAQVVAAGAIKAALEFATENMMGGGKVVKDLVASIGKEAAEKVVKESIEKMVKEGFLKKYGKAIKEEILGEVTNQIGSNAVDIYMNGKKDVKLSDGISDAAFAAIFSSGIQTAPALLAQKYVDKKAIAASQEKKAQAAKLMESAVSQPTIAAQDAIEEKAQKLEAEANKEIDSHVETAKKATDEDLSKIDNLDTSIDEISASINENSDPEVIAILEEKKQELEKERTSTIKEIEKRPTSNTKFYQGVDFKAQTGLPNGDYTEEQVKAARENKLKEAGVPPLEIEKINAEQEIIPATETSAAPISGVSSEVQESGDVKEAEKDIERRRQEDLNEPKKYANYEAIGDIEKVNAYKYTDKGELMVGYETETKAGSYSGVKGSISEQQVKNIEEKDGKEAAINYIKEQLLIAEKRRTDYINAKYNRELAELETKTNKQNDKENGTGVQSNIGEGKEPVKTQPIETTGGEKIEAGGNVQASEEEVVKPREEKEVTKKTTEVTPKEGDSSITKSARGMIQNMVFKDGEWQIKFGKVFTTVSNAVQKEAQDAFNEKNAPVAVEGKVKVKPYKQGDGGTKGVFEGEDGKLYKSIEPQEAVQDKEGNFNRQTIKDTLTDEHEILSDLQDNPHVPKVGKIVDTTEGKAFEIEKLDEVDTFTKEEYREIQKILNDLNDKGYHVGDRVTVMKRPKTGELVIIDFSAGYKGSRMSRDADEYMGDVAKKLSKSDAINIKLEDFSETNKEQANAFFGKESTNEYYLTQRPPSIGTHPTDGLLSVNEAEYRNRKNVYILKYDRKLTPNEIANFELTPKVTNKEFLGQKILGVYGKTPFYVTEIDYKNGIVKMAAEVVGKEVKKEISFREFSKNIDEGKYKVEAPVVKEQAAPPVKAEEKPAKEQKEPVKEQAPVIEAPKLEIPVVEETVTEPAAAVEEEEEQYEPITVSDTSHDTFTKDNAVDYEEGEKYGDNGRSYSYLASVTVELIDDVSGDSIGTISKLKDEDGEITWNAENNDGDLVVEEASSKGEAQQALVDNYNKQKLKEFNKEKAKAAKEKIKEAEKAKQKAEKEAAKAAKAAEKADKKSKPEQIGNGLLDLLGIEPEETTGKKTPKKKPVNVSNKSELAELENNAQGNKKTIIEAAKKAIATLKSIFPEMDIYLHEDSESYNETMRDEVGGVENSRGNFAFERDSNNNPTGRGRIDINLNNAKDTTVAHEITHAILLKAFGDNPALFKIFRDRISRILNSDLNDKVTAFEDLYSGNEVASEEYLTELSALLSQSGEKVTYKPSTLKRVAAAINDIVSKITKGKFQPFKSEVDFKNFVDFLNQISGAINEGSEINLESKESGDAVISGVVPLSRLKNKSDLGFKKFDVKWDVGAKSNIKLSVPAERKSLYNVVVKSGGAVVIINSDATGIGLTKDKDLLQGGIGYTFISENVNENMAFAASNDGKIPSFYAAVVDAANKRDAEYPEMKGKPVAVFVMVQTPAAMFGNAYSADYFGRVLKKITKDKLISTEEAKKELIEFIEDYKANNKTGEKYRNSLDLLSDLIMETDFSKEESLGKLVDLLISNRTSKEDKSAKFGFDIRRSFFEKFFVGVGTVKKEAPARNLRLKLKEKGYNHEGFFKEFGDKNVMSLLEGETAGKKLADGNFALTGFFVDPYQDKSTYIENSKKGTYKHKQFNSKFYGVDPFVLDGKYYVDKMFPEARFISKKTGEEVPVQVAAAGSLYPRTQRSSQSIVERAKKTQEESEAADNKGTMVSKSQKEAVDKAVEYKKESGTTQVATTTGSYEKAANILKGMGISSDVLDYGAGLGYGSDAMSNVLGFNVDSFEPNSERWKGKNDVTFKSSNDINKKYNSIVSLSVLNVVEKYIRDSIVKDIYNNLKDGGTAIISTRKWSGDVNQAKNAVDGGEKNSLYITRTQEGKKVKVFQKGFDGNELVDYIKDLLGDKVSVEKNNTFGAAGVIIKKNGNIKSKSQSSQDSKIRDYIESQREAGESDADIRAGVEMVADKLGLTKEDINNLMSENEPNKATTEQAEFIPDAKDIAAFSKILGTKSGAIRNKNIAEAIKVNPKIQEIMDNFEELKKQLMTSVELTEDCSW